MPSRACASKSVGGRNEDVDIFVIDCMDVAKTELEARFGYSKDDNILEIVYSHAACYYYVLPIDVIMYFVMMGDG